jgi:hypothetical protein
MHRLSTWEQGAARASHPSFLRHFPLTQPTHSAALFAWPLTPRSRPRQPKKDAVMQLNVSWNIVSLFESKVLGEIFTKANFNHFGGVK